MMDEFVDIKLSEKNLDIYFIRTSIFRALKDNVDKFHGRLLDVGCGKMPYKKFILENSGVAEYVGLDIETALVYDINVKPDIYWDGIKIPVGDKSFDTAIGTELLEHCFHPGVTLQEIHRVLKPGGTFFFTVPFLWNLHEVPYDAYRYTPFSLNQLLMENGFREIEIYSFGGWHSSFAQAIGLWVRRSGMRYRYRKVFSMLLKPIVKLLIKKDLRNFGSSNFSEGMMIPGLFGTCKK